MAVSIVDRLTQAIRLADQAIENAQYQADHRNWTEARRVMQDARDELQKPKPEPYSDISAALQPAKLDGRTKEARALKAANQ